MASRFVNLEKAKLDRYDRPLCECGSSDLIDCDGCTRWHCVTCHGEECPCETEDN